MINVKVSKRSGKEHGKKDWADSRRPISSRHTEEEEKKAKSARDDHGRKIS